MLHYHLQRYAAHSCKNACKCSTCKTLFPQFWWDETTSCCFSNKAVVILLVLLKCKCVCLQPDIPSSSADFPIFTPGIGNLSYAVSSREFSAFSAANAIHNSAFLVPPGTHHCWVDRGSMRWKAYQTPLHMPGSIIYPSTYRACHCLTSVIWWELVITWPYATTHYWRVYKDY